MSPDQLRKLVGEKNKQSELVKEVEEKKRKEQEKAKEEADKRWNEQKESVLGWFSSGAAAISQTAEDYQWAQTKAFYADKIKNDKEIREIRKQIKAMRKALKAQRLQGNRVETRHIFKRQRMEKHLIELQTAIEKNRKMFCETNYDATSYAKAMMKASKKWNKKPGNDEELALEAQLCRNMHQMLALEKQKAKCKKQLKEIKKYLQRCKSWLSDKQALCELHMLTLDATQASMKNIYEDSLSRQDKLISKLKSSPEFEGKGGLFDNVDLSRYDEIPSHAGPGATLNALRGLPFKEEVFLTRIPSHERLSDTNSTGSGKVKVEIEGMPQPEANRKDLYIEASDDGASINSALTDPDEGGAAGAAFSSESVVSADSVSGIVAFGEDAPWLDEGEDKPRKGKKKTSNAKQNGEHHGKSNGGKAAKSNEEEEELSDGSSD